MPISTHSGYQTVNITGLNLRKVPDTVIWTVQFEGLAAGANGGILWRGPRTTGQSFADFWEKEAEGGWVTKRLAENREWSADLSCQAFAVSEPGPPTINVWPGYIWGVGGMPIPPS